MSKKRSKTIFILKINNIDELDKKYGFTKSEDNNIIKTQITNINELSTIKVDEFFSFFDESKKIHKCNICMIDKNRNTLLQNKTDMSCFWCRHQFNTIPIGCPIKYISPQFVKQYYSEITKDKYTIKENITRNKYKNRDELIKKDKNNKFSDSYYYETDGIFCSFNCCLAFINDNYRNNLYSDSKFLLAKIYMELFDHEFNIKPAFSWRLLKQYGGEMSIEEFRDNLYKINYEDIHNSVKDLPKQYSIGSLYEEKIKF